MKYSMALCDIVCMFVLSLVVIMVCLSHRVVELRGEVERATNTCSHLRASHAQELERVRLDLQQREASLQETAEERAGQEAESSRLRVALQQVEAALAEREVELGELQLRTSQQASMQSVSSM